MSLAAFEADRLLMKKQDAMAAAHGASPALSAAWSRSAFGRIAVASVSGSPVEPAVVTDRKYVRGVRDRKLEVSGGTAENVIMCAWRDLQGGGHAKGYRASAVPPAPEIT
jgi:hypothetical protein